MDPSSQFPPSPKDMYMYQPQAKQQQQSHVNGHGAKRRGSSPPRSGGGPPSLPERNPDTQLSIRGGNRGSFSSSRGSTASDISSPPPSPGFHPQNQQKKYQENRPFSYGVDIAAALSSMHTNTGNKDGKRQSSAGPAQAPTAALSSPKQKQSHHAPYFPPGGQGLVDIRVQAATPTSENTTSPANGRRGNARHVVSESVIQVPYSPSSIAAQSDGNYGLTSEGDYQKYAHNYDLQYQQQQPFHPPHGPPQSLGAAADGNSSVYRKINNGRSGSLSGHEVSRAEKKNSQSAKAGSARSRAASTPNAILVVEEELHEFAHGSSLVGVARHPEGIYGKFVQVSGTAQTTPTNRPKLTYVPPPMVPPSEAGEYHNQQAPASPSSPSPRVQQMYEHRHQNPATEQHLMHNQAQHQLQQDRQSSASPQHHKQRHNQNCGQQHQQQYLTQQQLHQLQQQLQANPSHRQHHPQLTQQRLQLHQQYYQGHENCVSKPAYSRSNSGSSNSNTHTSNSDVNIIHSDIYQQQHQYHQSHQLHQQQQPLPCPSSSKHHLQYQHSPLSPSATSAFSPPPSPSGKQNKRRLDGVPPPPSFPAPPPPVQSANQSYPTPGIQIPSQAQSIGPASPTQFHVANQNHHHYHQQHDHNHRQHHHHHHRHQQHPQQPPPPPPPSSAPPSRQHHPHHQNSHVHIQHQQQPQPDSSSHQTRLASPARTSGYHHDNRNSRDVQQVAAATVDELSRVRLRSVGDIQSPKQATPPRQSFEVSNNGPSSPSATSSPPPLSKTTTATTKPTVPAQEQEVPASALAVRLRPTPGKFSNIYTESNPEQEESTLPPPPPPPPHDDIDELPPPPPPPELLGHDPQYYPAHHQVPPPEQKTSASQSSHSSHQEHTRAINVNCASLPPPPLSPPPYLSGGGSGSLPLQRSASHLPAPPVAHPVAPTPPSSSHTHAGQPVSSTGEINGKANTARKASQTHPTHSAVNAHEKNLASSATSSACLLPPPPPSPPLSSSLASNAPLPSPPPPPPPPVQEERSSREAAAEADRVRVGADTSGGITVTSTAKGAEHVSASTPESGAAYAILVAETVTNMDLEIPDDIDLSQCPGLVEITSKTPNWKRDMIEKRNQERIEEYVKNILKEREKEAKWKNVPEWKRKILMQKEQEETTSPPDTAKKSVKKAPVPLPGEDEFVPPKPKGDIVPAALSIDPEELAAMPPWKRELLFKRDKVPVTFSNEFNPDEEEEEGEGNQEESAAS